MQNVDWPNGLPTTDIKKWMVVHTSHIKISKCKGTRKEKSTEWPKLKLASLWIGRTEGQLPRRERKWYGSDSKKRITVY